MQYIFAYLAALAAVNGSPVPQGVTEDIAPQGGMPAGCKADYPGTFGIAVMTGTAPAGPAATEMADGQPAVNQIAGKQISGSAWLNNVLTMGRWTGRSFHEQWRTDTDAKHEAASNDTDR